MTEMVVAEKDSEIKNDVPELTAKEAKAATEKEEKSDLRKLESIVTKGDRSLALMAEALTEIRDRRLYKRAIDPETGKGFTAFAKYLLSHEEWGFTAQYANRLIANLRDQKAIEAGETPQERVKTGARELANDEAAFKVKRSFEQFASTIAKYRDATREDEAQFRQDFDKMYGTMEKAVATFVGKYPAPVADESDADNESE